jgi:hypothetical protein
MTFEKKSLKQVASVELEQVASVELEDEKYSTIHAEVTQKNRVQEQYTHRRILGPTSDGIEAGVYTKI